ncbi:CHAT domain-containing protein [Myxococcota bacterium]|nr:CHAT domain-containing protein [Myxococcota bacterium]
MATPSQLRLLEQLLSSSFSPAQLYQLLYGLFGQSFVGSLPPHQYVPAAQFYFEVVQRLEMNGYLLNNKMGQNLFAELQKERPGRGDEITLIATQLGVQVAGGGDNQRPPGPNAVAAIDELRGLITTKTNHPPQVCLRVNIAKGQVTAAWQSGDRELKGSADLPADTSVLHMAQQKLIKVTQRGGPATQIAEASSALGTLLSQHIFQPGIQAQFTLALHTINEASGELNVQLEFGGEEDLAQLSWELLREPSQPHGFLSTLPNVFLTRRYPRASAPFRLPDTPKKLLLVLGEELGREEANKVKALWEAKGLGVQLLTSPGKYELSDALADGPWDVVHLITHGHPELVLLKDTLNANQLANMVSGNVRSAVVLSVCTSVSANIQTDRVAVDAYDRRSVAWRGVAPALIGAGVPNVLAWTNLAYVDECARITPRWHDQYLKTGAPLKATQKARKAILAAEEYSFGWLAHFTG